MAARELPEKFLIAFSFAGEQRNLVRSIAEAVERRLGRGTVFFDEWFEYYVAGDDADLKFQRLYSEQCELAVVCVSERYGNKPWTRAEHAAIRARMMKLRQSKVEPDKHRMLPIRVGDGDVEGILFNTIAPDVRTKSTDDAAQLIVDRLRLIVPEAGEQADAQCSEWPWVDPPLPLHWPIADHSGARDAFACLLSKNPPWRLLPLCGPSETGKSHMTRQMLANALQAPHLACGRFDFKGTTHMDAELRAFVQDLGVALPPPGAPLSDCLANVLKTLRDLARPALVIFDTYEAAGEAEDWIEKQLLPCLIRATWLRVVIAGQRAPRHTGTLWASASRAPVQLLPPPPEDWLAFAQQHKPGVTLDFVRQAYKYCGGSASVLCALLGPTM